MPQRIFSALTWKAGVAIAATALAAGTGATTVHLVNASSTHDEPAVSVTSDDTDAHDLADDKGDDTNADGTSADDSGTEDDATVDASTVETQAEHPDNFGATVSEDAQDGGVDGQEISDMAHERNDARQTDASNASTEHADDEADDEADVEEADDEADDATEEADDAGDDQADAHENDAADDHGDTSSHTDDDTED